MRLKNSAGGRVTKGLTALGSGELGVSSFPYFIANVYMLLIVGALLVVLPYFVRI